MEEWEFAIVGAGVVGLAVAHRLARAGRRVLVLERRAGPGLEQSTHNSGVVHAGFTPRPRTLRALLAVAGNTLLYREAPGLGVRIEQSGTLVVAPTRGEIPQLEKLRDQGERNGVPGVRLVAPSQARELEPHLGECAGALWAPTGGRVAAGELVDALARGIVASGSVIRYNSGLAGAERSASEGWLLRTTSGEEHRVPQVVNVSGVASARVAAMLGAPGYRIYPCAGEYAVVRGEKSGWVRSMIYGLPRPGYPGIGVHLTRGLDGALLIGPTARYQDEEEPVRPPITPLSEFAAEVAPLVPGIAESDLERGATGVRAKRAPPGSEEAFSDYVIAEDPPGSGAFQLIGIESPGLTASLAIAEHVVRLIDASRSSAPRPSGGPPARANP